MLASEPPLRTPEVGLIGIGLLGSAIAERLKVSGFRVYGWDADPSQKTNADVTWRHPAAIAKSCARILLCLPDSSVVETVVEQIEPHLHPATKVIDATTGSPAAVDRIAARLALRDVQYSDACIGGSSEDVRRRRATVMFGGTQEVFIECQPIFESYAHASFYMGPAGAGTRMKLAFNLVLGLNRAVLAEGIAFARRAGIDPEAALDVLKDGAAFSRVMDTKGRKMIQRDFEPQARLSQHLKDVRLILEEGGSLPFSEVHQRLLAELEAAGYGPEDNSAIFRWFDQKTQ
jgi:3-hydroxyisobutyrate dehydrogenase-like beta-hydroxyacid dehydrogenase